MNFRKEKTAHIEKLSNDSFPLRGSEKRTGGEEIPPGGWRAGGEEIPPGGWRTGGEEIPPGGWRTGGEEIPPGGWRGGGEEIPPGGWRAGLEVIPEGGLRTNVIDTYRTRDGEHYFEFRFVTVGNRIDVDILAMPNYGSRTSDLHTTHRLPSERGDYKICFGDPAIITDLNIARKWAAMWSELTSSYIKTGTPFPNS